MQDFFSTGKTTSEQKPPTLQEIEDYKRETKSEVEAKDFYNYYAKQEWTTNGCPIKNWKALFDSWTRTNFKRKKPLKIATTEDEEFAEYIDWFNKNFDKILERFPVPEKTEEESEEANWEATQNTEQMSA